MQSGVDLFGRKMLEDWLERYFDLRARMPEALQRLAERPGEFEMIPVPRGVVNQMTSEMAASFASMGLGDLGGLGGRMDLGGLRGGGASSGGWDPLAMGGGFTDPIPDLRGAAETLEKTKAYPLLVRLVREFGGALEEGNTAALKEMLDDDYRDVMGRTKESLGSAIAGLLKATSNRRVIFLHAQQLEVVGHRMVGLVSGAWEAEVASNAERQVKSEPFRLEFVFSGDSKGRWKISSVRML